MFDNFQPYLQRVIYHPKVPLVATLLVGILLISTLYQTVQVFMPITVRESPVVVYISPLPDIAQFHLFGDYPMASLLPQTRLNLILQGVFTSTRGDNQALIASSGGPPKVYTVGESLVDSGVTIHQILLDSVILEENGKLEVLLLKRPKLQFGPPPEGLEQ